MSDIDSDNSAPEQALPSWFSSEVDVDVFGTSHQGHVRQTNEDHFLVIRIGRSLETISGNLIESSPGDRFEEAAHAMIVADGVGGEAAGEIASREAIFSLLNLALRTPDWQFRWGPRETNTVMWRMQERFRLINTVLLEQATRRAALNGMCTTMTAALSHGRDLIITHIGDSRAYLLHDRKLKRLTRDHTLGESLFGDAPHRKNDRLLADLDNVLTKALGGTDSDFHPDIHDYVLENGDQLLLCTDGLTNMVDDETIEAVLSTEISAVAACRSLVDLALSNGGSDNVTAIVAHYGIPLR